MHFTAAGPASWPAPVLRETWAEALQGCLPGPQPRPALGNACCACRDWGSGSEGDEDDEAGEGASGGLDLEELPDAGRPDPLLQG